MTHYPRLVLRRTLSVRLSALWSLLNGMRSPPCRLYANRSPKLIVRQAGKARKYHSCFCLHALFNPSVEDDDNLGRLSTEPLLAFWQMFYSFLQESLQKHTIAQMAKPRGQWQRLERQCRESLGDAAKKLHGSREFMLEATSITEAETSLLSIRASTPGEEKGDGQSVAKALHPALETVAWFSETVSSASQHALTSSLIWAALLLVVEVGAHFLRKMLSLTEGCSRPQLGLERP